MVKDTIKLVVEKFNVLPFIKGIVLGGSRARETHTNESDIDIGIYYDTFDLNSINEIAKELDDNHRQDLVGLPGTWGEWVNCGGWLIINGFHVDLIFRDFERVKQVIEETDKGIVQAYYHAGHPHAYLNVMYRGELAISKVLYSKNDSFTNLKKKAEIYPDAIQKSIIDYFLFEADFSLMFAKESAKSDDKYYTIGHIFRVISCINQVLFACNKTYSINEKKAIKMIDSFNRKIENYSNRINEIFETNSLIDSCKLLEKLILKVKKLI